LKNKETPLISFTCISAKTNKELQQHTYHNEITYRLSNDTEYQQQQPYLSH